MWFLSYGPKCSRQIKLHDSLEINISGRNRLIIVDFLLGISDHLRLALLIGCGQVCLSSNRIPGFCDQQYLCKESNLHGNIDQTKLVCETITLTMCG